MAESEQIPAQPDIPQAPGRLDASYFMDRLAAERGEAPSSDAQPPVSEDPTGETSEAQADALEADVAGETDPEAPSEEAQPEDGDEAAVTIDGIEYSPQQLRELIEAKTDLETRNHELLRKTNATWREQSEMQAHRRREFESRAKILDIQDSQYEQLAMANVHRYQQVDVSQVPQEQLQQFLMGKQQAEMGAEQLKRMTAENRQKREEAQEALTQEQAESTWKYLETAEPRWSTEFYGKLMDFAENELGYKDARELVSIREINGLRAEYDLHLLKSGEPVKRETQPPKPKKNRQQVQKRNKKGQFQSAENAVRESKNARADGSLNNLFRTRLEAEGRGG